MVELKTVLAGLDYSPLWVSLKTGVGATVVCFFLGLFAARKVMKLTAPKRAVIDGGPDTPHGITADDGRIHSAASVQQKTSAGSLFRHWTRI